LRRSRRSRARFQQRTDGHFEQRRRCARSLDATDPAHRLLLDIQAAAQRCVWKASGLLNFSARVHPEPVRASFEYLIDE
jgi:hypothetical protein